MTDAARPVLVNRPANLALVAGLLSFIPGVGLLAMVAGLIGGNSARVLGVGRGKAFVGVVLGMGSLLLWAMLVGAYFQGKAMMCQVPAMQATPKFIMLVGSGNVTAAKGMCTDAIDIDRLTQTAVEMQELGGLTSQIQPSGGQPVGDHVQVEYRLPFAKGDQMFVTEWTFVDAQPRLVDYKMTPAAPAATQPTK